MCKKNIDIHSNFNSLNNSKIKQKMKNKNNKLELCNNKTKHKFMHTITINILLCKSLSQVKKYIIDNRH